MADHSQHDQHAQENKPVAFVTPLILGLVTVLVILSFVSLGNPKHHSSHACCEGKEQCEHATEGHHGAEATEGAEHHASEANGHETHEEKAPEAPAHEEAHH